MLVTDGNEHMSTEHSYSDNTPRMFQFDVAKEGFALQLFCLLETSEKSDAVR